jgi:hypothetical protein
MKLIYISGRRDRIWNDIRVDECDRKRILLIYATMIQSEANSSRLKYSNKDLL